MHDLGFLYIPYSVAAYRLTGNMAHREIGLKAADELAKRFMANGGYIRAWGRMDDDLSNVPEDLKNDPFYTQGKGLTIIDCMMNLPLLYWAWEETKNPYYLEIAKKHSDTTIDNYFRKDGSVYHVFRFDAETGNPIGGNPLSSTPDEVYWARGHAWAIYGFALGYAHTKEKRYLEAAIKISNKFIEYSDDKGLVCNNLIDIKKGNKSREVSASIIAACGFDLLDDEIFKNQCEKILDTIINEDLINREMKYSGILKSIDMPYTTWGDYYLMELLAKRLYSYKIPW